MALIVVERDFSEPSVLGGLQAKEDAVSWCLEQHGVTFLYTYFAKDGRRMVCLYDAPDAEAVRHTQRVAGLPVSAVWNAEPLFGMDGLEERHRVGDRGLVIVRREFPKVASLAELEALQGAASWCFEANQAELLQSYVHRSLTESVCVLSAVDVESVRKANRTVGLPVQTAWAATFHSARSA